MTSKNLVELEKDSLVEQEKSKDKKKTKSSKENTLCTSVSTTTPEMSQLCLSSRKSSELSNIENQAITRPEQRESNLKSKEFEENKVASFHEDLEHSVVCLKTNCESSNCLILKRFLFHQANCLIKSEGGCSICFAFDAIVYKHSVVCKVYLSQSCPIPNCDKTKTRILENWMRLKVMNNNIMQRAFNVLSHSRICQIDRCKFGKNCNKMKSILIHLDICSKKDCPTKQMLHSLCQNHKESCNDEQCPVDFCRKKFKNKELKNDFMKLPNDNNPYDESSSALYNNSLIDVKQEIYGKETANHHIGGTTLNEQTRRPYSFGDRRQLPRVSHVVNTMDMRNLYTHVSPIYKDEWLYKRDVNISSNATALQYQNDNLPLQQINNNLYHHNDIPTPKDYASVPSSNCYANVNFIENYENYKAKPYALWPSTKDSQNDFSPRQLQKILFSRDTRKDGHEMIKSDSSDFNMIPSKKLCLGEYDDYVPVGPHTPDESPIQNEEKSMNCVRRLFPTNCNKNNIEDSDTESELCKKLSSQTDDSHSICSDQLSLVF